MFLLFHFFTRFFKLLQRKILYAKPFFLRMNMNFYMDNRLTNNKFLLNILHLDRTSYIRICCKRSNSDKYIEFVEY